MLTDEQLQRLSQSAPEDVASIAAEVIDPPKVAQLRQLPPVLEQAPSVTPIEEFEQAEKARTQARDREFLAAREAVLLKACTPAELVPFAKNRLASTLPDTCKDVERQLRSQAAQGVQRVSFTTVGEDKTKDWTHEAIVAHLEELGWKIEEREDGFRIDFAAQS